MADFGLYNALRGTDDWRGKRQDKAMNLLAAEKREARAQQDVAQRAAAESDINKYMEELQNLEVLPEDQERVSQAEKHARQKVVAGIAQNNGDLNQFMSSGGTTILGEYKNAVMGSEEVKQAGVNKINLQNYIKQDSKGNQRHKFVDVDVPIFDEEGNQVGTEKQKMSFQDQYNLYKEGKIKQLNYNGSENKVNIGVEDFSRLYKNPNNIYQEDNFVTQSNIYTKALSKGASEEQAREISERYVQMHNEGGDAWRWNAGDPYELALRTEKLRQIKAAAKAKAASANAPSKTATLNMVSTIERLGSVDPKTGEQYGNTRKAGRKEIQSVAYQIPGLVENKDIAGDYSFNGSFADLKAFGPEFMNKDGKPEALDLSQAENIQPTGFYAKTLPDGGKRYFMLANVEYEDASQGWSQLNPINSPNMLGLGPNIFKDKSWVGEGVPDTRQGQMSNNWQRNDARGTVTGESAIDITEFIKNKEIAMQINSMMNYDRNQEMFPGTASNSDYFQQMSRVNQTAKDEGSTDVEMRNYLAWLAQKDIEEQEALKNK